ncbi:MAG: hypothetical protein L3V56_00975 [Candidatus Magnetoovum sp. WYHC-5]|nr:hypothetical protein [Candidatus Magnetoovum sp. WYHC-5]
MLVFTQICSVSAVSAASISEVQASDLYKVRGRVSFKNRDYRVAEQVQRLLWQPVKTDEQLFQNGWFIQGQNWIWPSSEDEPTTLSVPIGIEENAIITPWGLKAGGFDEILIEYTELFENSHCDVDLELNTSKFHSGDGVNFYTGKKIKLVPALALDIHTLSWQEKDNVYRLSRKLGLPSKNALYYTQDGDNVVLQRRFDVPLNHYDAIDIVFASGTFIKEISLRLKIHGNFKTQEKIIPWSAPNIQADIIDKDNVRIVRFWLFDLLNEYSKNKEQLILDEIIMHLPGQLPYILNVRPLNEIRFQRVGEIAEKRLKKDGGIIKKEIEYLAGDRRVMRANLDRINAEELMLNGLTLKVSPSDKKQICGIELKSVQLVRGLDDKAPEFYKSTNKAVMDLAGAFYLAGYTKRPWPTTMDGFLSFAFDKPSGLYTDMLILNKMVYSDDFLEYEGEVEITPDYFGLKLEGNLRYLTLVYPARVDIVPDVDYKFWFGIYESTNAISNVELVLNYDTAVDVPEVKPLMFTIKPNTPITIGKLPRGRAQMTLKVNFIKKPPYTLLLKEGFLYHMEEKPVENIFADSHSMSRQWFSLYPNCSEMERYEHTRCDKNSVQLIASKELSEGLDAQRVITIKAAVDKPIETIQWLSFSYVAPWQLTTSKPHWLTLEFEGDTGIVTKVLELPLANTEVNIHVPSAIGDNWQKMGNIKNIIFKINGLYVAKPKGLPFNIVIKNLAMSLSGRQHLATSLTVNPIVSISGKAAFLPLLSKQEISALMDGGVWVDLGEVKSPSGLPHVNVWENPLVKVEDLVIEKTMEDTKPPVLKANSAIDMPTTAIKTKSKSHKLQLIVIFIFGIAAILFFKVRRLQPFITVIVDFIRRIDRFLVKRMSWLAVLGFTAFGLGFYVIGLTASTGRADNYGFTVGSIAFFMAIRILIITVMSFLREFVPNVTNVIYRESGNIYIFGFIMLLPCILFFVMLKLEPVAEQVAVVGFYFFIIGIGKRLFTFKNC